MNKFLWTVTILFFASCNKPSTIEVRNDLSNVTIKNIFWGEVPIAYEIPPSETSGQVKIYEDAHYNFNFPEDFPLQFSLNVNGKEVVLLTDSLFRLASEDDILIPINDSTPVTQIQE